MRRAKALKFANQALMLLIDALLFRTCARRLTLERDPGLFRLQKLVAQLRQLAHQGQQVFALLLQSILFIGESAVQVRLAGQQTLDG